MHTSGLSLPHQIQWIANCTAGICGEAITRLDAPQLPPQWLAQSNEACMKLAARQCLCMTVPNDILHEIKMLEAHLPQIEARNH